MNIEERVRARYHGDEYREVKARGGMVGGRTNKGKKRINYPQDVRKNINEGLAFSRRAGSPTPVLCVKDLGPFQKGKRYTITAIKEDKVRLTPSNIELDTWYDLATYFKRYKIK